MSIRNDDSSVNEIVRKAAERARDRSPFDGERCTLCDGLASEKIEQDVSVKPVTHHLGDEFPHRGHPLTAYVCSGCFAAIFTMKGTYLMKFAGERIKELEAKLRAVKEIVANDR